MKRINRNDTTAIALMMMAGIVALLTMIFWRAAYAEGVAVGPNCTATWDASPGATGYRVYVGATATTKTQRAQVTATTAPCSALNLTAGQQYAHVTAYNVAGESGAGSTIPFTVMMIPAPPTGLSVQ